MAFKKDGFGAASYNEQTFRFPLAGQPAVNFDVSPVWGLFVDKTI
jgi:hypothetical protein